MSLLTMRTTPCPIWTRLLAGLVLALSLSSQTQAAEAPQVDDNIHHYLQLLRSDSNPAKVQLVDRIMNLSGVEAKKFWPVYREYENELGKLCTQRAEFIADYMRYCSAGTPVTPLANARTKEMAKRYFKNQRARLALLEKYHGKIERSLSAVHAGQFLQIEQEVGLFVDVVISAEIPPLRVNPK